MDPASGDIEPGASAFLDLAMLVAGGWVAARFIALSQDNPAHRHMRAAADYWLGAMPLRAALHHAQALSGS
jgi:hypothetical protein